MMTPKENEEIKNQVLDFLDKGLVRESLIPCFVPTILSPANDGGWRVCTNSRSINIVTIRYIFPLPNMDDLIDCLIDAMYFSKVDLKSSYQNIRIREGDEYKTNFETNDGLYEWLVIPFGLTNAPSTFMRIMNEVLKDFIGKFVIVYLDDIFIFIHSKQENLRNLRLVLRILQQENLLINLEKCSFAKIELVFLGFMISQEGLKMNPQKVKEIVEWPSPRKNYEVRSFHGFKSFYNKFSKKFSNICAPIVETIKREHYPFGWSKET